MVNYKLNKIVKEVTENIADLLFSLFPVLKKKGTPVHLQLLIFTFRAAKLSVLLS